MDKLRMSQMFNVKTALGYIECEEDNNLKTNCRIRGAFTTVLDLEKFWNGLWAGKLLGTGYRGKVLTTYEDSKADLYYGYGVGC